jgi:hypothetical protein
MPKVMINAQAPSIGLLVKLGSLIVHYQEMNSAKGHAYDKSAIETLEKDAEVVWWLSVMTSAGFLPVKR